jgi:cytochrome c oxidase cbb3-type subunit 3
MDEKEKKYMEKNKIKLLDHDYDGIQEFDQKLPNWWLFTLYITIIFSVFFWVVRHQWMEGKFDLVKLEAELAMVEEAAVAQTLEMLNDEALYAFAEDAEWVAKGETIFVQNCAQCHLEDLSGSVGPNLVDDEWIHGSNPTDMYNTVKNGVLEKGMQPWDGLLSPKQMAEVVAYVISKQE